MITNWSALFKTIFTHITGIIILKRSIFLYWGRELHACRSRDKTFSKRLKNPFAKALDTLKYYNYTE